MKLTLPYPAKELWPNSRPHYLAKNREAKKLRTYVHWAVKEQAGSIKLANGPIRWKITVCPKTYGPPPDRDNAVSAAKSILDGIADALGVNDRHFAAPVVEISRERTSKFIVEVGE